MIRKSLTLIHVNSRRNHSSNQSVLSIFFSKKIHFLNTLCHHEFLKEQAGGGSRIQPTKFKHEKVHLWEKPSFTSFKSSNNIPNKTIKKKPTEYVNNSMAIGMIMAILGVMGGSCYTLQMKVKKTNDSDNLNTKFLPGKNENDNNSEKKEKEKVLNNNPSIQQDEEVITLTSTINKDTTTNNDIVEKNIESKLYSSIKKMKEKFTEVIEYTPKKSDKYGVSNNFESVIGENNHDSIHCNEDTSHPIEQDEIPQSVLSVLPKNTKESIGLQERKHCTNIVKKKDDTSPVTSLLHSRKELQLSSPFLLLNATNYDDSLIPIPNDDKNFISLHPDMEKLSNLSPAQLQMKVAQLLTVLDYRSKWEAMRLKEFLFLQERKMTLLYQSVYQKQRLSYEDTLLKKLGEQEDRLIKQYQQKLKAKDKSIQLLVDESIQSMTKEHEGQIQALDERYKKEYKVKYEAEASTLVAEMKSKFQSELQQHVSKLEELSNQVQILQETLLKSKQYEDGSMKTHRICAAALAFASKLESNTCVGDEYRILKEMTSDSSLISSALAQVSEDRLSKGIPTVSDLQSSFESILPKTRQAIFVPAGVMSLRGQCIGYICSRLLIPIVEKKTITTFWNIPSKLSYILSSSMNLQMDVHVSKAHHYLQHGNLEQAVQELDQLETNHIATITLRDWINNARNRILVDRALHVIKIECALLNEQMSE